jgi:hypothetical protein
MITKKELAMLLGKFKRWQYQSWNITERGWAEVYGRYRGDVNCFVAYCAGYLVKKQNEESKRNSGTFSRK